LIGDPVELDKRYIVGVTKSHLLSYDIKEKALDQAHFNFEDFIKEKFREQQVSRTDHPLIEFCSAHLQ
jgi:hypothetical protein